MRWERKDISLTNNKKERLKSLSQNSARVKEGRERKLAKRARHGTDQLVIGKGGKGRRRRLLDVPGGARAEIRNRT